MSNQQNAGKAVITGASSGIGAIYADRLARRGHDLILVARNQARLEQLAARIERDTGRKAQIVVADLGKVEGMKRVEQLLRDDPAITVLVNNAGVGAAAPLLQADVDAMQAMIDINVTAVTRLTYAVVPAFVARGAGTIINIASIVAVAPTLLNGVYGGSKAFVLAFTQSLQHELAGKGVRVQAVLPGATRTEFWDVAGHSVDALPQEWVMSGDDLVDAALAGFDQGEVYTVPSLPEVADWDRFEAARAALAPNLSHSKPAARFGVQ
ncbi:SDR family NAD(P)-dependent oxidoreductase [Cupriavidus plantarum]|uniref:NADP-dependent 3-hydroxy acid dehydrogenase YdfG n=1 Tax=Cupriavidus plantarum TaxID=942865 RepID=A0A316ETM0_9BURK|nr:SDR family oxidoreductase [Cupriavidus plantarum]NYI00652.1 hypothetical protein [Cupriavidus plantarum]PWK35062.1 hypothetical protein C7419_102337 [Cupriavidus plantarum]REE93510.1 hypothetical protein C7418_2277 [Cupriavidus plantarum]